jgi:hypothetical protein
MEIETRNNLRRMWLSCLYEFAQPALQVKSWIEGTARWPDGQIYVSGFDECFCTYFDDLLTGRDLAKAVEEGLLSPLEAEVMKRFHDQADTYKEPAGGDAEVLRDPKWHKVVATAAEAWCDLQRLNLSDAERSLMQTLEAQWGRIEEANKPRRGNPYQPFRFDVFP